MVRDKWHNFLIGGGLIILLYISISILLSPVIQSIHSSNRLLNFANIHLLFAILLILALFITSRYNRINPKFLINWEGKIKYKSILWGFLTWFSLLALALSFHLTQGGQGLIRTTNIPLTIKFFFLSSILTPIQIMAEEFLFRGYLIKFLQKIKNKKIFIIAISSIVFALMHLNNPEVEQDKKLLFILAYLTLSIYLTVLTVQFKGMEYSIGIHFANNFFAINFLNYPNSPLPSMPLFLDTEKIDPVKTIITSIILISITTTIIHIREKYVKKHNI